MKIFITRSLCAMAACLGLTGWAAENRVGAEANGAEAVPLTEVILYSSGVGYFQRDGRVEGETRVDLRFKVEDINDLLKSLVVRDLDGGRISTVTYDSRDPITKTLKSFAIDLTSNPSLGALLNQVRGEEVEVQWPTAVTGIILGIEKKWQPAGDNRVEVEHLNLLTAQGLQSVPLPQVQRIRLLNERLEAELRQALRVLALGHDTQKKTVSILFDGAGERAVSVAYIAQTPVWKTSYRLVLSEERDPFLQGWAIVENTTDEDWDQVRLALVSGRPISFIMDLYQPLYATRPVVEPELYASLRPQVYGEAMDKIAAAPAAAPARPMAPQQRLGMLQAERATQFDRGEAAPAESAAFFSTRGIRPGAGVVPDTVAGQAGELFQYTIQTPVTLSRQSSAMLPIVSETVSGEKVSIYNQNVQARHPLHGFRLRNNTAVHWMQGPVTVFDGGAYAGDARIEDVAPGQERLLSYGLDLNAEVEPQTGVGQVDLVTVKIRNGTLVTIRKSTQERLYNIRNRDRKPKLMLIEHPFRSDWTLISPEEPAERTRDVYRFQVRVEPDQTSQLAVEEERQWSEQIQMVNLDSDTIAIYLRTHKASPQVKAALERMVELRHRLNRTSAELNRRQSRIEEISREQQRIRENMTRLSPNTELHVRYVRTLDGQEDELQDLRLEIEGLRDRQAREKNELDEFLLALDVE